MDDIIIKYVSSLGFPIAAAIFMGIWLSRLGNRMLDGHMDHLQENTKEMKAQTTVLREINATLPTVCRADCINYRSRSVREN